MNNSDRNLHKRPIVGGFTRVRRQQLHRSTMSSMLDTHPVKWGAKGSGGRQAQACLVARRRHLPHGQ